MKSDDNTVDIMNLDDWDIFDKNSIEGIASNPDVGLLMILLKSPKGERFRLVIEVGRTALYNGKGEVVDGINDFWK